MAHPSPDIQQVLGIVGGGQLARMTHQAAIPLAVELRFLADRSSDPAPSVAPGWQPGSGLDPDALRAFEGACDIVTFDHEVVDLETLTELEGAGATLRPSAATLRLVADKLEMRNALAVAGVPVPDSRPITVATDFDHLPPWTGFVVKRARGGYDGRGVFLVHDVAAAREVAEPYLAAGERLLVEPFLRLDREIAVLAARRPGGEMVIYDPVETLQVDGQCRQITMPAGLAPELDDRARAIARTIAEAVDVTGILAVEFFQVEDELWVNELAARPHNSGHHTIDATVTSQFENHVRAVMDLPLGSPEATCAAAATVNVIGRDASTDPRHRLAAALASDRDAHIHLYGKSPRFNRKLGHVTVCDHSVSAAVERARRVAEMLGSLEVTE